MKEIIFLGTGPTSGVKRENEIRTNSSIIINKENKKLLIDCTPNFLNQVDKEKIYDLDLVLITHAHKDAMMGLESLDNWIGHRLMVLAPPRVLANERFNKKFKNLILTPIIPEKMTRLEDFRITPFRVMHYEYHPTLGNKFPTYGYVVDEILYAEDMESIPINSEKYFAGSNILILDANMWFEKQTKGHMNLTQSIDIIKKYNPTLAILIQAGNTYPSQDTAELEIMKYLDSNDIDTNIMLAYDGLKIDLDEELSEIELAAFGSPGGKSHILKKLKSRMPPHKIYAEPFAGGAALFWSKESVDKEYLNDLDSEISFAYNFIKTVTPEQVAKLKQKDWSSSKEKFFQIKNAGISKDPIERFYNFYYLYGWSYGGNRSTFGYLKAMRHTGICDQILKLKERLQNTTIYNKDANEVITECDSPDTFIYLDPPYPGEWPGMTGTNAFTKDHCQRLHDTLKKCKGKFLLSINMIPWIVDMFKDFKMVKISVPRMFRADRVNKKWAPPKQELLIFNYDAEKLRSNESLGETGSGDAKGDPLSGGGLQPIKIWKNKIKVENEEIELDTEISEDMIKELNVVQKGSGWCVVHGHPKNPDSKTDKPEGATIKCFYGEGAKEKAEAMHKAIMISEWKIGKLEEESKLSQITEDLDKLNPFLDNFKSAIIIKDFISLVGSQVKRQADHVPNDYDLHVRMDKDKISEYLERSIKIRISKMVDEKLSDKIHIFCGDSSGGHDSFVPIYDLALIPVGERKIVNMSKKEIDILEPYLPQKPSGSAFYDINDFLDSLE